MQSVILLAALIFLPATAYGAFDSPGLYNEIVVKTSGYDFPVEITSTFDIKSYEFDRDAKRLSIFFETQVTENVAEFVIPSNLIGGNLSFYLDDDILEPKILHQSEEKAFVAIEFSGKGDYKLDVVGTTYLPEFGASFFVLASALAVTAVLFRYGPIRRVLP